METKLVMLIVDEANKEELEAFLHRAGVVGYTELSGAVGSGETGPRLGSRAFPKTSAIIFTVVAAADLDRLLADVRTYCAECSERLKILVWGVQDVLAAVPEQTR